MGWFYSVFFANYLYRAYLDMKTIFVIFTLDFPQILNNFYFYCPRFIFRFNLKSINKNAK